MKRYTFNRDPSLVYPKVTKEANMLLIEVTQRWLGWFKNLASPSFFIFTMKMKPYTDEIHEYLLETKAYMYVLECADGSFYPATITLMSKICLKTHNAGKQHTGSASC